MEETLLVALMYLGPVFILIMLLLFVVAKSRCSAGVHLTQQNGLQ